MITSNALPLISDSVVETPDAQYALTNGAGEKHLVVSGDSSGFTGERHPDMNALVCPLSPENALRLRERLAWLQPAPLGMRTSVGFGDRLGYATPGHVAAIRGKDAAPIFAQQSVRENARTGRTPQQVLDDAMWGVFESGWRQPWGADADHLKALDDVQPFVAAGYTFYTIDPGAFVNDSAEAASLEMLREKARALDWQTLESSPTDLLAQLSGVPDLNGLTLELDEASVLRAAVKYGAAVVHSVKMAREIARQRGGVPFDLEISVDETATTTSHVEHVYIAHELKRLGIPFVSLAPRFVGRFEKGVDYIGDLEELSRDVAGHAAIMEHFGNTYKLSLHTGSDKFGVYPIALQHTGGRVHLKTAGTSYLEALRVIASIEPALFRRLLDFSRAHYEEDRRTYHVSGHVENVPPTDKLTDAQLPDLLNQFDARQVLHVTFGSVLDDFGEELNRALHGSEKTYHAALKTHFDKHLAAFPKG